MSQTMTLTQNNPILLALKPSCCAGGPGTFAQTGPMELEQDWHMGGKYRIRGEAAKCFATPDMQGEHVGIFYPKDVVTMIDKQETALHVLEPGKGAGWVPMYDLVKKRLPGSWNMKSRYAVRRVLTLRRERHLSSEKICDVQPGEEVLVLEIGYNLDDDARARLRALVKTTCGNIGWMSPQDPKGNYLLEPVDLLSPAVADVHRRRLARKASFSPGQALPWAKDGMYRTLEALALREHSNVASKAIAKLPAGTLLNVMADLVLEYDQISTFTAFCPMARVLVRDGTHEGRQGWVRCVAEAGHACLDTRDQIEFDKVLRMLSDASTPVKVKGKEEPAPPQQTSEEMPMLMNAAPAPPPAPATTPFCGGWTCFSFLRRSPGGKQ